MKKYVKIIMLFLIFLFICGGIIWYLNNYNKLEEGFASIDSNNWPELINKKDDTSNIVKGYLVSTYGDGKKVSTGDGCSYGPDCGFYDSPVLSDFVVHKATATSQGFLCAFRYTGKK